LNINLASWFNQEKQMGILGIEKVRGKHADRLTFQLLSGLVAGPQQCSSVNGAVTPLDWN
ncbi:hypothetical protein GOODEAATRI_003082, partial [Goodea atripinnis]